MHARATGAESYSGTWVYVCEWICTQARTHFIVMHELRRCCLSSFVLRRFHSLRHLKHILERGGAKAIAIIDHRVRLPAERLAISKWILCNHLGGSFFQLSHQVWALKCCPHTPPHTSQTPHPTPHPTPTPHLPLINIHHESVGPNRSQEY